MTNVKFIRLHAMVRLVSMVYQSTSEDVYTCSIAERTFGLGGRKLWEALLMESFPNSINGWRDRCESSIRLLQLRDQPSTDWSRNDELRFEFFDKLLAQPDRMLCYLDTAERNKP